MAEIHAARRQRAQEKIAEVGADAALITSGPNVRYLTGLASSNAALLLAADGTAVLATDSRRLAAAPYSNVVPCILPSTRASAANPSNEYARPAGSRSFWNTPIASQ